MNLSELDPVTFPPRISSAAAGLDRRAFLRLGGLAGGGLALALYLRPVAALGVPESGPVLTAEADGDFSPNLFVHITAANEITLLASNPECGQGVKTSLPMLIAEELDVAWEQVRVAQAGLDSRLGRQAAAGSRAMPTHYEPFRKLGAVARHLFVTAAAARWAVPVAELTTPGDARVVHAASGRAATYGELAAAAANLPLPDDQTVAVKNPADFRLLGRRITGVDNATLVVGQPLFGIDVRRPGQKYAALVKCPVFGGVVRSADFAGARAAPGVRAVFEVKAPGVASGVAIVADSTWQAWQARSRLRVEWDEGRVAAESSARFATAAEAAWRDGTGGKVIRNDGDFEAEFAAEGHRPVEARYTYPFLSHANLEPQNCTALVSGERAELWAPSQNPDRARADAARALGLPPEAVTVHLTRIGGGFGRRLTNDYAAEVAAIARELPGTPVQLVWDRTDDMRRDWYRPGGYHALRGAVDASGRLVAWSDHYVSFAAGHEAGEPASVASLAAAEFPSRLVKNCLIRQEGLPNGIPMGPWRAPRTSAQCFAQQCFLDELALAAGRDPVAFRLELLGEPRKLATPDGRGAPFDTGRMAGVVREAAARADWGTPLPKGSGRGIAFQFSHLGYAAVVIEVTVSAAGRLTIDRAVVAADVGRQIVNLSGAENQSEGSVVDGISSSLLQRITIEGGRVVESGFADMPLLRLAEAPKRIETHFVITDNPVTGLGEPIIPPVPPALGNAIFAATGKRIRDLPFADTSLGSVG